MSDAPARAAEVEATAVQIFTKQPNRWAEHPVAAEDAEELRAGPGIGLACSHDSHLMVRRSSEP